MVPFSRVEVFSTEREKIVTKNIKTQLDLQQRKIPSQKRAEATLNHILLTSAMLLEEVGIDGFNTNLLAERADLRVATIYRYYPNKHSIVGALVEQLTNQLLESMEGIKDLADPDQDWRVVVNNVIDSYIATAQKQPGFVAIRRALLAIPQLRTFERTLVKKVSALMVTALKQRGVQVAENQLFSMAGVFMMTGSNIYEFASARGKKNKEQEARTIDEMRLLLTSYLANYIE